MAIRYSIKGELPAKVDWGRSRNISAGSILFDSANPLRIGMVVEISIPWPHSLREQRWPWLRVEGCVVRVTENEAAATFRQYGKLIGGDRLTEPSRS